MSTGPDREQPEGHGKAAGQVLRSGADDLGRCPQGDDPPPARSAPQSPPLCGLQRDGGTILHRHMSLWVAAPSWSVTERIAHPGSPVISRAFKVWLRVNDDAGSPST